MTFRNNQQKHKICYEKRNQFKMEAHLFFSSKKPKSSAFQASRRARNLLLAEAKPEWIKEEANRRVRLDELDWDLTEEVKEDSLRFKQANFLISEASMANEIVGTGWSTYHNVDRLIENIANFPNVLLKLDCLIIAEKNTYEYLLDSSDRRSAYARRKEVKLMYKRFLEFLLNNEIVQGLRQFGRYFELFRQCMEIAGTKITKATFSINEDMKAIARARLDDINRSLVVTLSFHPLTSLQEPETVSDTKLKTNLAMYGLMEKTEPGEDMEISPPLKRTKLSSTMAARLGPPPKAVDLRQRINRNTQDFRVVKEAPASTSSAETGQPRKPNAKNLQTIEELGSVSTLCAESDLNSQIQCQFCNRNFAKPFLQPHINLLHAGKTTPEIMETDEAEESAKTPRKPARKVDELKMQKENHQKEPITPEKSDQEMEGAKIQDTTSIKETNEKSAPSQESAMEEEEILQEEPMEESGIEVNESKNDTSSSSSSSSSTSDTDSDSSQDSKDISSHQNDIEMRQQEDEILLEVTKEENDDLLKEKPLDQKTESNYCGTLKVGNKLRNPQGGLITIVGKEVVDPKKDVIPNEMAFSSMFTGGSFGPDCNHNCVLRFLSTADSLWFSKKSRHPTQGMLHSDIKKYVDQGLLTGPYNCFVKSKVPSSVQLILAKRSSLKGDERHHHDPHVFIIEARKRNFFESIEEEGFFSFDTEGVEDKDWKIRNNCVNVQEVTSLVHLMAPNGIHLIIQCLYNGTTFLGVEIPPEILNILWNERYFKVGFGITKDAWDLNRIFKNHPNNPKNQMITNLVEAGKIELLLDPEASKTGKGALARRMGFFEYFNDVNIIKPSYAKGKDRKNVYHDNTKHPKAFIEQQNRYHRYDTAAPILITHIATLEQCKFYKIGSGDNAEIKNPRIRFFRDLILAMITNKDVWDRDDQRADAGAEGSQPRKPPYANVQDKKFRNPLRTWINPAQYRGPNFHYARLDHIAERIMTLNAYKQYPILSILYKGRRLYERDSSFGNPLETWTNFKHPHLCRICGKSNHGEENCTLKESSNEMCQYPFCNKGGHLTRICPMVTSQCNICTIPGHLPEHHEDMDFDIGIAFQTFLAYSERHMIACLVHEKERIFTTEMDPEKFKLKITFPTNDCAYGHEFVRNRIEKMQ